MATVRFLSEAKNLNVRRNNAITTLKPFKCKSLSWFTTNRNRSGEKKVSNPWKQFIAEVIQLWWCEHSICGSLHCVQHAFFSCCFCIRTFFVLFIYSLRSLEPNREEKKNRPSYVASPTTHSTSPQQACRRFYEFSCFPFFFFFK